jgi:hypothetical protein
MAELGKNKKNKQAYVSLRTGFIKVLWCLSFVDVAELAQFAQVPLSNFSSVSPQCPPAHPTKGFGSNCDNIENESWSASFSAVCARGVPEISPMGKGWRASFYAKCGVGRSGFF